MPAIKAVLIDLYETAWTSDFGAHEVELPRMAGVPAAAWNERSRALTRPVMDGRMSLADAFADAIVAAGGTATPEILEELVRRDGQLLAQGTTLYADTVPFLEHLRDRGIRTALVSNCAENTRALVDAFALTPLVDAVVLSCEVGFSKPAHEIFRSALDQLAVDAPDALLVDDQQVYCDGARSLGMSALRIDRAGTADVPGSVTSFVDVQRLLT